MKFKIAIITFVIVLFATGGLFAAEDICYICHNSSLLEENRPCTAWTDHSHPVNVKPSWKINIPTSFPLNDKGQIDCKTCHLTYGDISIEDSPEKNPRALARKIYLRTKNIDSSLCKMCHTRKTSAQLKPDSEESQYDFVVDESFKTKENISQDGVRIKFNHPVDVSSMRIPRQLAEASGGNKSEKDQIICETCHRTHKSYGEALLTVDNERGLLCGFCHGAMYAKDRVDSGKKGTHPVNIKSSTVIISPDIILRGGKKNSHGEIICLTCHAIHSSETPRALLVKENIQSSLCMECHKKKMRSTRNTKHDIGQYFANEQNIKLQIPSQSGMCGTCHLAHGGTGPKMWARPIDKKEETITDLCKSCHTPGKMAGRYLVGAHTHPVGVSMGKIKENISRYIWLPLYSKGGMVKREGVITCATCHNTHQWEPDDEVASPDALETEGDETNSFLRIKDTNSKLCIFCHKRQKLVEKTVHDPRLDFYEQGETVPALIDMSGNPIDPPKSRICSACHVPHKAQGIRLWARELGQGSDSISRLCSSCHRDGFIASEKQIGKISHPNNIPFSRPFPIQLPVYNKQLATVEKGQILCITCHNVHQWDPDVAKPGDGTKKEGTAGDSFLRIAANSRKKSLCDDCHIDRQWIKNTDHDLVITAPDEIDLSGRTPRQAGVCATCHAVHNAPNQLVLWNRKLGPGKDKISSMCNSCHYRDQIAQTKTIGSNSHPVGISTFSILDDIQSTSLPIFNENYKQIYQSGDKLAPIFFAKDLESRAKIESIKMYFRVLSRNYAELRKKMPDLREKLTSFIGKIDKREDLVTDQKLKRADIQKKIDDSIDQYKKLEFNLSLLRTKKRLLERISSTSNSEKVAESVKKLDAKIKTLAISYKKTEKYFNDLYKEIKVIRRKYWKRMDWIELALKKADLMKTRYIRLIDTYKETKKDLESLIAKIKGRKKNTKLNMSSLDKLDQVFKDRSFVDNLTKQDLIRKLFDFRQKYFYMVRKMEELKKKTGQIMEASSDKYQTKKEENEKRADEIRRDNLDLDYHIANSFDDSDVQTLEELGQGLQGKMFCTTCHNPHKWNPKKNDFGPGKQVEGGNSDSFLRVANDFGSALCINCHKEMEAVEGTDHDLQISAPSETNYKGQNTQSSGVCGSCHLVHNAAISNMLWSKTVTPDKNKDTISLLCETCHNPEGCASTKTVGKNTHVMNVRPIKSEELESELDTKIKFQKLGRKKKRSKRSKGKIRKKKEKTKKKTSKKETKKEEPPAQEENETGELEIKKISVYPLFTFGGNRNDKSGKIFCSTCHNVHQWKPGPRQKGPQIPVEGTARNSFLRDDNSSTPTLCINCHTEKSAVIGTKHDLAAIAPDEKNIIGQTANNSGVCSPCHLVHNAANKYSLWARPFGPNIIKEWDERFAIKDDKTVQMCNSCHSEKGIAHNSIPEAGLHFNQMHTMQKEVEAFMKFPTYPYFNYVSGVIKKRLGTLEIFKAGAKPKFPLYNPQGRITPSGNIVCPTCHDIHTWSVKKDKDKNRGDFSSSFLRPDVAEGFCSDCHEYDAIFLFAYYHKKRKGKVVSITNKNPHWERSTITGACRGCHNDKVATREKHPTQIRLVARKRKIKIPDLSENFPLTEGKVDCPTCHSTKIQNKLVLRTSNPRFLRGEFYTPFWRNKVKKRTLAMVRKAQREIGRGFGGFGRGIQKTGRYNIQSLQKSITPPSSSTNEIQPPLRKKEAPARKSPQSLTAPGKGGNKPSQGPTSQLDRSSLLRDGYFYFYDLKELIISPWRNLFSAVRKFWGKIRISVVDISKSLKYIRSLFLEGTFRTRLSGWESGVGVSSVSYGENSNPGDDFSQTESSDQVRLYAQVKNKRESYFRKSYRDPYFQKKGQQGKPKIGRVKRLKKPPTDEKVEDEIETDLQELLDGRGVSKDISTPVVVPKIEENSRIRIGPRKDMVPRITEEMLRARKKKWAKKRKKRKKRKKVVLKKFVEIGPPTATNLLVWTTNEDAMFGPNRYALCYECHVMDQYKQFNPHVNQMSKDNTLNQDMCILCHTQIPNRKTIDPSEFYLRASMEKYCIGCHIGMTEAHPAGETHYGRKIPSVYRKRINNLITSSILFIPTKDKKLVCPSCHNTHQKGVILKKMADRGADEKGRMRFFGYETCNACHKGVTTPTDSGSPF